MEKIQHHELFRKIALAIVIAGAIAAAIFVISAGHNNKSILLRLLFIGWVLSPFVALVVTNISTHRALNTRVMLYWLSILIAIVSPVGYSGILSAPGEKLTPVFLLVPLVTWVVLIVFILVSTSKSQRPDS